MMSWPVETAVPKAMPGELSVGVREANASLRGAKRNIHRQGGRMARKGNSAASVNTKMPLDCWVNRLLCPLNILILIDIHPDIAIDKRPHERHNLQNEPWRSMSTKSKGEPPKVQALLEEGTLNPAPDKVRDPKFRENEFFDPRDLVQVKYEMLRRVSDRKRVGDRRHRGVRRFEADVLPDQGQLRQGGVAGLVPQKARSTRPA